MIIVYIAHTEPAAAINSVKRALDIAKKQIPRLNGASFDVKRNDYTYIDNCDELIGYELLHSYVYPALGHTNA